ncbi:MAG: nitrous oxide-stimulated promoter family protein [Thermodesulfobacteriota bacterium]|nr:nitrous oxide-stimulated promoter family protein [Thermodesulfobacteriota bacterium]
MKKEQRIAKDAKVLRAFIAVYCRAQHLKQGIPVHCHEQGKDYCDECYALLHYALQRNERCPLDPKPVCRQCAVHCYKPQMRRKIREVMKFSGIYYIKRGRLDWLWHYFFD